MNLKQQQRRALRRVIQSLQDLNLFNSYEIKLIKELSQSLSK